MLLLSWTGGEEEGKKHFILFWALQAKAKSEQRKTFSLAKRRGKSDRKAFDVIQSQFNSITNNKHHRNAGAIESVACRTPVLVRKNTFARAYVGRRCTAWHHGMKRHDARKCASKDARAG